MTIHETNLDQSEQNENTCQKTDWDTYEYLRPQKASEYTGLSLSKLARLRMKTNDEDGPSFMRVSGCIVYSKDELDSWMRRHTVTGPSDQK